MSLGLATSANAQPPNRMDVVNAIRATSQELLNRNTNIDCYTFTRRVLDTLNDPHWGHVGKTQGEGQFPLAGLGTRKGRDGGSYVVTGVSHDAIYFCAFPDGSGGCNYGPGDWQVDLLGNGNDGVDPLGSPAIPQWNVIPQQFYRPNNPFIGVVSTGTNPPTPNPAPTPTPSVDLSAVTASLARLEAAVAALADSQAATRHEVSQVGARVEAVLTSTDRIIRQMLEPVVYKGSVLGFGVTLRPTITPVTP